MERRQNVVLGGIVAGRPALDVLVVAEHDVLRLDGPRLLRHDLGQWGVMGSPAERRRCGRLVLGCVYAGVCGY